MGLRVRVPPGLPNEVFMYNLGYACINMGLSGRPKSKRITTNRSMIRRTFDTRGLPYASELTLQNCLDLERIIQWNHDHGIKFYRMSSDIAPWHSEYELEDLPDFRAIAASLRNCAPLSRDGLVEVSVFATAPRYSRPLKKSASSAGSRRTLGSHFRGLGFGLS